MPPQPHIANGWTAEEIDRLRELIKSGATSSQIAVHFPGKSRNAILGKAFRLGLRLDSIIRSHESFWSHGDHLRELAGYLASPQGYSQAEIARRFGIGDATVKRGMEKLNNQSSIKPLKPNAASMAHRNMAPRSKSLNQQIAAAPKAPPIVPDAVPETAILIWDLTGTSCRWPVKGEGYQMLYCGAQALEGRAYCGRHCRMAYTR